MVNIGNYICPNCGGKLVYYDKINRILRGKYGNKQFIKIRRLRCKNCRKLHSELPNYILPYRHYRKDIVEGFTNGTLSNYDICYEDYPCESTINEWVRTRKKQVVL